MISDDLASIRARVDALKPSPPPRKRSGGAIKPRAKGSRVIDGKVYSPEQVKEMGLSGDTNSKRDKRRSGHQQNSGVIQGNQSVTIGINRQPDGRSQGRARGIETQSADTQRSTPNTYQPIGDGRETESAPSGGNTRADSGNHSAEGTSTGFRASLRSGAGRLAGNAFERMANLGKPKDETEYGPSSGSASASGNGNGFHPVERVSEFFAEEYAQPFTEDEADEREQEVIDMIIGYSYDLDDFLSLSNAESFQARGVNAVWAMDADEAAPIARIWLKRAKHDRRAAATLRLALQGDDYKRAAIVLGPRLWRTATFYPQHGGWKMQPWETRKGVQ